MKQNKKGFTLIELLAVIVILAIIALIATPIILNMINEARKSAAKSSTLGFVDSIEYYAGFSEANAAGGIGITGYSEKIPTATKTTGTSPNTTTVNVTVTCGKAENATAWTTTPNDGGSVTAGTSCDDFFKSTTGVVSKAKGKTPDVATIVLDKNGKVQAGTSMKYNGYTCSYNGSDVTECTK